MHLTHTTSSEELVRTGKTENRLLVSHQGLYVKTRFDLNGDPRVGKLVEAVQSEIKKHHWDPVKNEKEISETTVKLIHSDKFFGPYDKRLSSLYSHIGELDREQAQDLSKQLLANNKKEHLTDFKKGELVCKQEAAIASYTLHKVGIPNDYCFGNGREGVALGHVFVQNKSGNIVETTLPNNSFNKSIDGKRISDGQVAIVIDKNHVIHGYGGGNMQGVEAIGYTFSPHKANILIKDVFANSMHSLGEAAKYDKDAKKAVEQIKEDLKKQGVINVDEIFSQAHSNSIPGSKDHHISRMTPPHLH